MAQPRRHVVATGETHHCSPRPRGYISAHRVVAVMLEGPTLVIMNVSAFCAGLRHDLAALDSLSYRFRFSSMTYPYSRRLHGSGGISNSSCQRDARLSSKSRQIRGRCGRTTDPEC